MTSIPPFITAKVISAQNIRLFPGKGYVEKAEGDGNFVITLSSGKITVQCTPGSLSEGDTVLVKAQGKDVIIEKVNPQTPFFKTQFLEDTLDLRQSSAVDLSNAPQTSASKLSSAAKSGVVVAADLFSFAAKHALAEGFYYFDTIEKALSWLSSIAPGYEKRNQDSIPNELANTSVVLQVVETENEGLHAILLPLQAADSRLSYFVREQLQSSLWKAFFPEGLLPTLINRQGLSSERIIAIDLFLPKIATIGESLVTSPTDSPVGIFGSMGKNGAHQLFVQWLNIALDETTPPALISKYPPLLTASGLPPLVEKIQSLQTAETNAPSHMPGVRDFSINQSTFECVQAKENIVPRILERLGINYENALFRRNSSDTASNEMMPNLKHFLLTLEGKLELAISQKSNESSGNPLLNVSRACQAFSEAWNTASRRLVRELFPTRAEPSFPQGTDVIGPASNPIEAATKHAFDRFQEWSAKILTLMGNTTVEASEQAGRVQKASSFFDAVRDESASPSALFKNDQEYAAMKEAAGAIDKLVQSISGRIKTAFGEIAEKIDGFVQSFSTQIANLSKDTLSSRAHIGGLATGAVFQEALENMQPLHLRLRAQIHAAMREIALNVSRQMRAISELTSQTLVQSSKLLKQSGSAAGLLQGKSTLETTRQLVQTALERIDSVQVSAKPTAVGDVRQQVVMVPMNIDGTWNDVLVTFVRDDTQGRKKSARKNILVSINVAPSFLGEINVSMNYKGIKDCSIQMDFDSGRTLSWFEKNRRELMDSFGKIGFEGLNLNMQKSVRHRSVSKTQATAPSDAAIDIVI